MSKELYCIHHYCRCRRAEEFALMAEASGRTDLLAKAVAVHSEEVRCLLDKEKT
jgi:hypothetical protein